MRIKLSPPRPGLIGLLLLLAAPITVFGADEPPARKGNVPPLPGRIFLSDWSARPDPTFGIFTVDPNESTCVKISDEMALESRISPDGRRAIGRRYDRTTKKSSLWVIDVGGKKPAVQIAEESEIPINEIPCWAGPEQVLMNTINPRQPQAVWRVNADGTGRIKLPLPGTESVEDVSFDGKWLLTRSARPPAPNLPDPGSRHARMLQSPIYIIRSDGSGERQLIPAEKRLPRKADDPDSVDIRHARFSPDGKRVLYTRSEWKLGKPPTMLDSTLWIVDTDGNNRHRLLDRIENRLIYEAAWAPDGKTIAVMTVAADSKTTTFPPDRAQLWLIDPDGKNPRNIHLPGPADLSLLDWR